MLDWCLFLCRRKGFYILQKESNPLFLQSNIYMWVKVYEFKYILLHLFEIFVVLVVYFPWVYFQVFWLLTLIIYFFYSMLSSDDHVSSLTASCDQASAFWIWFTGSFNNNKKMTVIFLSFWKYCWNYFLYWL